MARIISRVFIQWRYLPCIRPWSRIVVPPFFTIMARLTGSGRITTCESVRSSRRLQLRAICLLMAARLTALINVPSNASPNCLLHKTPLSSGEGHTCTDMANKGDNPPEEKPLGYVQQKCRCVK